MIKPTLLIKQDLLQKAFRKKKGFFWTFASVTKYSTIQILFAIAVHYGCHRKVLDVEPVFLSGSLEEEIFLSQQKGLGDKQNLQKV